LIPPFLLFDSFGDFVNCYPFLRFAPAVDFLTLSGRFFLVTFFPSVAGGPSVGLISSFRTITPYGSTSVLVPKSLGPEFSSFSVTNVRRAFPCLFEIFLSNVGHHFSSPFLDSLPPTDIFFVLLPTRIFPFASPVISRVLSPPFGIDRIGVCCALHAVPAESWSFPRPVFPSKSCLETLF